MYFVYFIYLEIQTPVLYNIELPIAYHLFHFAFALTKVAKPDTN